MLIIVIFDGLAVQSWPWQYKNNFHDKISYEVRSRFRFFVRFCFLLFM